MPWDSSPKTEPVHMGQSDDCSPEDGDAVQGAAKPER
jgi:hypothetical protein